MTTFLFSEKIHNVLIHPSQVPQFHSPCLNKDNFRINYPTGLRPVGPATMLRVKRKDVKMCNIGSGAAAAGTEDGFGEGQAVAGTIISKFSSQPVTAVDNEDDEDSVSIISISYISYFTSSWIFHLNRN